MRAYVRKLNDSLFNNKIILKSQQRFKSDHRKVYTEEVDKIALSSSDNKRLEIFDRITAYPYHANAFKVCESEIMVKIKICRLNYITTKNKVKYKKISFDDYTNENSPYWPYIPDHPYRILIIGSSGCGKTNALFNLINNQPDIAKIYMYAKDLYEPK